MNGSRRSFVVAVAGAATALIAPNSVSSQSSQRSPQPMPEHNAPTNAAAPGGFNNYPSHTEKSKLQEPFDAAQMNAMVEQLYQLATELKEEAAKTNLQKTLPVNFIKHAQDIEKLAKTIRKRLQN